MWSHAAEAVAQNQNPGSGRGLREVVFVGVVEGGLRGQRMPLVKEKTGARYGMEGVAALA